jgi:hypothetical protein
VDRYEPVIVYDYVVGGTAYRGRRVAYNAGSKDERAIAEAIVARYPVGRRVRVLFNPGDSADAYREPTNTRGVAWTCVIAAVALALGRLVFAQ